jgi:hypothetical protein
LSFRPASGNRLNGCLQKVFQKDFRVPVAHHRVKSEGLLDCDRPATLELSSIGMDEALRCRIETKHWQAITTMC